MNKASYTDEIEEAIGEITNMLPEKDKKELSNLLLMKDNLLKELEDAIITRSEELCYDYGEDYKDRLRVDDEEFAHILASKVLTGKIGELYSALAKIVRSEQVMTRVRREMFEDLVYETIEGEIKIDKSLNLVLINNGIGVMGKDELEVLVSGWNGLKSLKLGWNGIGGMGVDALKVLVGGWKGLKSLYLNDNGIGVMGKEELEVLKSGWKGLKILNLIDNGIGEMGKEELGVLVSGWKGLKSLDLTYNEIGGMGKDELKVLAEGLKDLTSLELRYNKIGGTGKEELDILVSGLKGLKYLDLQWNDLSDDQKEYIRKELPDTEIQF